jgi:hypothetical protein
MNATRVPPPFSYYFLIFLLMKMEQEYEHHIFHYCEIKARTIFHELILFFYLNLKPETF